MRYLVKTCLFALDFIWYSHWSDIPFQWAKLCMGRNSSLRFWNGVIVFFEHLHFAKLHAHTECTESFFNKESFKPLFNQKCQYHLAIIISETGDSVYLSWSGLKFGWQLYEEIIWIFSKACFGKTYGLKPNGRQIWFKKTYMVGNTDEKAENEATDGLSSFSPTKSFASQTFNV